MKKIKGLLYCTKANLSLYRDNTNGKFFTMKPYEERYSNNYDNIGMQNRLYNDEYCTRLNGTIVAECDFEVEEIVCDGYAYLPLNSNPAELETKGCLNEQELENYFTKKYGLVGYALHITNLKVFDKPRDIRNYYNIATRTMEDCMNQKALLKAPKNMCNAYDVYKNHYIVISIKPKELCKILNGEQTIFIRKQVLNCMKGND